MKYKYKLNNLTCPNCALKIEDKLNKDEKINNASINFAKMTLSFEISYDNDIKKIVSKIVKSVEPDVTLLDLNENIENSKLKINIIRLILGIILFLLSLFIKNSFISNIFIILSYIVLLYRTFKTSLKLLIKSKCINENLLVTISCIGAYLTNNIHEGLMVIILYEIGKILEDIAVNNSRRSISNLMNIKAEYANLLRNKKIVEVDVEDVKINDIIIVKQGEKIPLDGIVIKGCANLNTSALTGESKIKKVSVNDKVLSGSINEKGLIEVKVVSNYKNSTVSKILELTENASDKKAKTETFVAKVSKIYTPIILILAILISIILPLLFNVKFSSAIYRALVFLVVSCPCAIAISVPLAYFSGLGKASKEGILIKGSNYLDSLSNANKIIFDKTGTITKGYASDYKLNIINKNYKKEDIINYYLKAETLSNHPIAKSIINIFNRKVKTNDIKDFKEISGCGVCYKLKDKIIKIGSSKYILNKNIDNLIYLSINDEVISSLELFSGIKDDSKETISILKKMGIKTLMFTGDDEKIASDVSSMVGIDKYEANMLPIDKYERLEEEINNNDKITLFVGDGINDAPALALASVGISMGSIGQSSAIEASDIVIMNDKLSKIPYAIKLSKYTKKIIKQNLIFAIGIKILVLLLSFFGIASMWQAVFADTGVTLLTILNTTRILSKKY